MEHNEGKVEVYDGVMTVLVLESGIPCCRIASRTGRGEPQARGRRAP